MEYLARWMWLPFTLAIIGVVAFYAATDRTAVAIAYGGLGALAAWWMSPASGRGGATYAQARKHIAAGQVVVFWRPGCMFCSKLRLGLGVAARRVIWVNVWSDVEASEYVKSVNSGDEIVPTVVINGVPHTNPEVTLVRAAIT